MLRKLLNIDKLVWTKNLIQTDKVTGIDVANYGSIQ